jgi:hypothetical protein
MSIPTYYEMKAEHEAMIKYWKDKFEKRFGYDAFEDLELAEWGEYDFEKLYKEMERQEKKAEI